MEMDTLHQVDGLTTQVMVQVAHTQAQAVEAAMVQVEETGVQAVEQEIIKLGQAVQVAQVVLL